MGVLQTFVRELKAETGRHDLAASTMHQGIHQWGNRSTVQTPDLARRRSRLEWMSVFRYCKATDWVDWDIRQRAGGWIAIYSINRPVPEGKHGTSASVNGCLRSRVRGEEGFNVYLLDYHISVQPLLVHGRILPVDPYSGLLARPFNLRCCIIAPNLSLSVPP